MDKEGKKPDLRVQKTRSALTSALYDLLCQKSFDDVTVTELCEKAVIRKATFYKHFSVIYAGAIVSCGAWRAMQKNRPDREQMIDLFSEFLMKL